MTGLSPCSLPFSRNKISRDPNNTAWARNTSRFGHQILSAQGWTPGQTLGRPDAEYAEHYTAASASHIRVAIKDDNYGLGAIKGKADGERFGLELLSGLLGRLNGKTEVELQKEEKALQTLKTKEKWSRMGFVSGGFMVGDEIVALAERAKTKSDPEAFSPKKDSKKRKRSEADTKLEPELAKPIVKTKPAKKSKKEKRKAKSSIMDLQESSQSSEEETEKLDAKKQRKEEKRRLKEEKRARKEARRMKRESKAQRSQSSSEKDITQSASDRLEVDSRTTSGISTPTLEAAGGRHAVRSRYIQHKRMVLGDQRALNEVSR
jgi:Pin2-interacting protein X1